VKVKDGRDSGEFISGE